MKIVITITTVIVVRLSGSINRFFNISVLYFIDCLPTYVKHRTFMNPVKTGFLRCSLVTFNVGA